MPLHSSNLGDIRENVKGYCRQSRVPGGQAGRHLPIVVSVEGAGLHSWVKVEEIKKGVRARIR
jgi:hypothetical protein